MRLLLYLDDTLKVLNLLGNWQEVQFHWIVRLETFLAVWTLLLLQDVLAHLLFAWCDFLELLLASCALTLELNLNDHVLAHGFTGLRNHLEVGNGFFDLALGFKLVLDSVLTFEEELLDAVVQEDVFRVALQVKWTRLFNVKSHSRKRYRLSEVELRQVFVLYVLWHHRLNVDLRGDWHLKVVKAKVKPPASLHDLQLLLVVLSLLLDDLDSLENLMDGILVSLVENEHRCLLEVTELLAEKLVEVHLGDKLLGEVDRVLCRGTLRNHLTWALTLFGSRLVLGCLCRGFFLHCLLFLLILRLLHALVSIELVQAHVALAERLSGQFALSQVSSWPKRPLRSFSINTFNYCGLLLLYGLDLI